MPRPKPKFEDYEHLLTGLKYDRPVDFIINTLFKVYCDFGHEYIISIGDIKNRNRDPKECPHCKKEERYNKENRIPYKFFEDFANEFNFGIKNKKDFYSRWGDNIVFICKKCGEYEIEIKSLRYFEKTYENKRLDCQDCLLKEKGLKTNEELKKYLDTIEYKHECEEMLEPINYDILPEKLKERILNQNKWNLIEYKNTKTFCKYQCRDCGSIKNCSPYNLFVGNGKGFGCYNCYKIKTKKRIFSKLKDICKKNNIFIEDKNVYASAVKNINFKCNKCGCTFVKKWKDKEYGFICNKCTKIKSKSENIFADYIEKICNEKIKRNDREQIKPLELDVFIPNKNIAFEFCGGIWHSSKFLKDNYLHRTKYELCEKKGIRLITIFEDEWLEKKNICKSRIKNLLGLIDNKFYARKGIVKQIENKSALEFCEEHHIQGKGQSYEAYGLFINEELVSVMTFSKPSVSKHASNYDWELNRFCSKKDSVVIGGANKLLSLFENNHKGELLVTFCDLRWGTGKVYEKMGFYFILCTRPNYYYIGQYTDWKRKHRFNFTKQRLIKLFNETDHNLKEWQIAEKNGLYKIHDCGHLKFQKQI